MDIVAIAALAALFSLLAIAFLRSVMSRRRRWLWLLALPVAFFACRWAGYRGRWPELGLAVLLAALVVVIWWLAYGRRLPPPSDDNIRVWTKDDPF